MEKPDIEIPEIDPMAFQGVMTEAFKAAIRKRNAARIEEKKRQLGHKYVGHPCNRVQRDETTK